ncbi:MAG TPA: alpha-hydroxy-acid oxidizing protein [Chitinivibrionales bacterium]|jgi:isopentenyl diphosphate isomerase/L-lactate dehydrogenase-like FMN-dependent dehydrogenase|nr:alpha-hydroxy-acid oxidizing protein [Chitinivibrionales bacterium]
MPNESLSLEEIRETAKVKLKGICGVYRICDGQDVRMCQGHSYGSPIGIGGIGSGASFANNIKALDAIRLKARLIGPDFQPDTRFEFFGRKLSMPIMAASASGNNSFGGDAVISEPELCRSFVTGCKNAGTMGWRGDSFNYSLDNPYGIDAIAQEGGWGVQIVKPREQATIISFFKKAELVGCAAVGVDIDGYGSNAMARHKQPVFRKSVHDLKELVSSTVLPVIIKGVMSVEDAEAAVDAGAAAIVVSNHGGRVLDHTPGTVEVLPGIAKAVGSKTLVMADGGIRTGYDALKMLASGAMAVLVGRDVVRAAVGAGAEGVVTQMKYLGDDLAKAMKMTGCASLDGISPAVLC